MHLTEAGKIFIVCVIVFSLFAYWLTKRFLKRLKPHESPAKSVIVYWWLVIFCLISLFAPFTFWISQSVYYLVTKPTYQATITAYQSEWVDVERKDSSGRTSHDKQLMYTAQLTFLDQQQHQVTLPNSIRSGEQPVIGEQLTIVYETGDRQAQEKSLRSVLLLAAAGFMLLLIGYVLLAMIAYALNWNMQPFRTFTGILVMRIIIPLGTMSMLAMLAYVPFKYFFLGNPNQFPIWAIVICSVFSIMLLPVIYHFLTGWTAFNSQS